MPVLVAAIRNASLILHGAAVSKTQTRPLLRGIADVLATVAFASMTLALATAARPGIATTAALIYGLGYTLMFIVSSTYHVRTWGPVGLKRMRRLDHSTIFLCLAASYAPLCLVLMPQDQGVVIYNVVLAFAALGVTTTLFAKTSRARNIFLYIVFAGAVLFMLPSLFAQGGESFLLPFVQGGLLAALGVLVYACKWPNPSPKVLGYHEIFHFFIISAAILHFQAVYAAVA